MMFNEYMDHANQCAGYYSVTRKEEITLQQSETNRFKQKWLESSGGGGYSAPSQNPTPPLGPPGQQFNKSMQQQHVKQEHSSAYQMAQQGQFMNNQYKAAPVTPMQLKQMNQPSNLDANNQHIMMKQQQQQQQQMKAAHAQKMQQSQAQMQYQQQQQLGNKYYEVISDILKTNKIQVEKLFALEINSA